MSRVHRLAVLCLLLGLAALAAQDKSVKPGINDAYKDPDLKKFLGTFEGESREIYTLRDKIVKACQLKPGQAVADIGAGTGLFTRLFAAQVGNKGKVYAVDIAPKFLEHIKATSKAAKLTNVETVKCDQVSSNLKADSVDVAFVCDTYHHFEFPSRTLATIHKALRKGGQLVVIDFERVPGKSRPWALDHVRAGKDIVTKEITAAGFKLLKEEKDIGLKENYFLRFEKVAAPAKKVDKKGPKTATLEFNRDVRPILSDACFTCHGPDKANRKGGLRLDTEEGGKKAVVPGKPDESELIRRLLTHDAKKRMPPAKAGRQVSDEQVKTLKRWVAEGANWQPHWAFVPVKRPPVPAAKDATRARNPIDRFVLARLEAEGLAPSPEAPASTLLRRVTLDLTGLPPSLDDIAAAETDRRPGAYERLVDRLLASPRYGERMGLDWLDAARYADSNGYQSDQTRTMWPWRDWAVRAFNANMPFDRFTVEQIAGDLLPGATVEQKIASGFHRNHMLNGEGGRIAEESRVDYVVDRVDTTATVWLGLTLGCSRCHDHKFDPFTAKEYYRLYAYFNNIAESGSVDRGGNAAPVLSLPTTAQTARLKVLRGEVRALEGQANKADAKAKPGIDKKLKAKRAEVQAAERQVLSVMVMQEREQPRETYVLLRGAYDQYGEKVGAGVPSWLAPMPKDGPANRLGLARWLVSERNPLTARVIVNRYWGMLFGTGLVKTAEDFGVQGEQPSHPELLDWLAAELVESGWDLKHLLRLIVTSATYRQSSAVTAALRERDPGNRLLARGARHRLASTAVRDQALAHSGLLVERVGGAPVKPYQPAGIWEEMSFGYIRYVQDKGESLYRRSLYTFWRRTVGPTNLFDTSSRQVCVVGAVRTNTPVHALITLNDVTFVEAARVMAARALREGGRTPADRAAWLFRLATARRPDARERAVLARALTRLLDHYRHDRTAAALLISAGESPMDPTADAAELAAYAGLCNLILNLDEVLCKE